MKRNTALFALLPAVLLCIGGGLFLWKTGFFSAMGSVEALQDYILSFAPYSHLVFFLFQFLSVVLAPIPSNISAMAGGLLFGTWTAFFLTASAVLLGSMLVFFLARTMGRGFAEKFVSQKLSDKYLDLLNRKTSVFLFLALLLPFFPDDLLCILAGLTPIRPLRFFVIALIARPWGLLVACAVGGSTLALPWWGMALLGAAGLAFFGFGLKYGDKLEEALLRKLKG